MSILVNPHNEHEEKLLLEFLNNMKLEYKPGVGTGEEEIMQAFLDQYNKEIDEAEAQIESGNFLDQDEVEKLFADRRKK